MCGGFGYTDINANGKKIEKKNKALLGLVRPPNLQGYFQTKMDLNEQSNPYLLVALVPFFFRVDEGFIKKFISL